MNTRAKGTRFENDIRRYLEACGWWMVRQASSAFPDLVGKAPWDSPLGGYEFVFECKVNGYPSKEERAALEKLQKIYNLQAVILRKKRSRIFVEMPHIEKRFAFMAREIEACLKIGKLRVKQKA